MNHEHFPAARYIKEIGRGVKGARALPREDARTLYAAMLERRVSDLELGAIVLAMRIKGESPDELAGFLEAAGESFAPLPAPAGDLAPVLIPAYNGARKLPNLTPLLAALLARHGVPVLVHGVTADPGRVTTCEIMARMGMDPCTDAGAMRDAWAAGLPAFMPIGAMAPQMAALLALRDVLGVRNSTHTLVKLLQPFDGLALRLVSYTHPEYLETLGEFFARPEVAARGDAFLMRGTEGETVANANRGHRIDWFRQGQRTVLVERDQPTDEVADLPMSRDADVTAAWIAAALSGAVAVPSPIAQQVDQIVMASRDLAERPGTVPTGLSPAFRPGEY